MDERELEEALVGPPAEWSIETAFEQIEACGFECVAGPLENNTAYRWLKEQAL